MSEGERWPTNVLLFNVYPLMQYKTVYVLVVHVYVQVHSFLQACSIGNRTNCGNQWMFFKQIIKICFCNMISMIIQKKTITV